MVPICFTLSELLNSSQDYNIIFASHIFCLGLMTQSHIIIAHGFIHVVNIEMHTLTNAGQNTKELSRLE